MVDEKYAGKCLVCADYPPFYLDDSITASLLYNPWCLFCYRKKGKKDPTSFWPRGKLGRFSHTCECGWEAPTVSEDNEVIDTSPKFGQVLVDHFLNDHKTYISDALITASHVLGREVIPKYLVPKPSG